MNGSPIFFAIVQFSPDTVVVERDDVVIVPLELVLVVVAGVSVAELQGRDLRDGGGHREVELAADGAHKLGRKYLALRLGHEKN